MRTVNIEVCLFEVCDLGQYPIEGMMSNLLSDGFSEDERYDYAKFLEDVKKDGFTNELLETYHDLGSRWHDTEYNGTYNPNQDPELIESMFE